MGPVRVYVKFEGLEHRLKTACRHRARAVRDDELSDQLRSLERYFQRDHTSE
jgi:hypothetical protein